ncbi:MAG: Spy/CpxP family protein refolding chaperone [Candidatus Caldatribacteriaceae bacterium]
MKKAMKIVPLLILAVLVMTPLAFANPRWGGAALGGGPVGWQKDWQGQEPGPWRGFVSLNLTDDQKAKILEIEKNYMVKFSDLRAKIEAKQLEIRELQLKAASEEVAQEIRTKIGELLDLQNELATLRKSMVKEILSVLTPEQLKNLPAFGRGFGRG